jgi:hypothetical protein
MGKVRDFQVRLNRYEPAPLYPQRQLTVVPPCTDSCQGARRLSVARIVGSMDSILDAIAQRNGGFFTRAQALDSGWTDRDLAGACHTGVIRRLRQGAYAPARSYDGCDGVEQHLILARAVLARQRGDVALTGVSAAAVHGLCLHGHDLTIVHLVRLDGGSARREVGARHQVVGDDVRQQVEIKNGIPLTNVARTLWEVAGRSTLEAGVATADSCARLYPDVTDQVKGMARTFDARPGSRLTRLVLRLANGKAESPGESYSRVLFWRHALPAPQLQHRVVNESGRLEGIADFCWELDRHLGEFDGKVKYGRFLREGEGPADAVFREKRREDRMRAQGFGMTRWIWQDLTSGYATALVRQINADRERSRRLYASNRTVIG